MARNAEEERATVVGKLVIPDEISASKLLLLMRKFRDAVEMAHSLLYKKGLSESEVKRRLTKYLSNAWYAYSAIKVAKLYREQKHIKLRKPQLYSVGSSDEKGNRNIKLVETNRVLIKIPHEVNGHEWAEYKVLFGEKYIPVINELISGCYTYGAGVSIKIKKNEDWRDVWSKRLILYLNIPINLYAKYMGGVNANVSSNALLWAGFDFNVDRVCMAIIDSAGRLRDTKTVFFSNAVNVPREVSESMREETLAELVKYAVAHGVKYLVVEDLERPRGVKGKVGKWALRQYIQHLRVLAKRFNLDIIEVNPAYSSIDAIGIALAQGLDKHTASAYLIALRGLRHQ
jgi:hypothetical protein